MPPSPGRGSFVGLVLAFSAVYLLWGASFLAVRVLVVDGPPLALAGVRFSIAGALLLAWCRARGHPFPGLDAWRRAAASGLLLFFGTYGAVFWAMQHVPSGQTALVMATIPILVAGVDGVRAGGTRSGGRVWFGLGLGLAGVALIAEPWRDAAPATVGPLLLLGAGAMSWALGTVYMLARPLGVAKPVAAGMQMLVGGVGLLVASRVAGEPMDLGVLGHMVSFGAFAYLIVGASVVAFLSYTWLLDHVAPAAAASYAFVNPLIAVWLGWWILDEMLTWGMLGGGALVLASLALVQSERRPAARPGQGARPPGDRLRGWRTVAFR